MKRCTVSVIDDDGEPRQVAVNATGLFDAVDQAIEQWSRLWCRVGEAVSIEVRNDNRGRALANAMIDGRLKGPVTVT
jgi:hypothetical protein